MYLPTSLSKAKRAIKRVSAPITKDALRKAISAATGGGCDTLYVHSGISSLGHMLGGPGAVANELGSHCDNLFLPTHTYCYPEAPDQPAPVFDATATGCPKMGILADTFWRQPGVFRSIHSTHSLAGKGDIAEEICAEHYQSSSPCGAGTPYSRLVHRGAGALMIGVNFRYYTPFHTAEWESGSAFAYEPDEVNLLRFIDENGVLQERPGKRQNRIVPRFDEAGEMLERQGFVTRVPLGRSHLLYIPDMLKVHDFLVDRLRKIPDFLRSTCSAELV
jgi:aminoglycoside 3-N-acetyltransferase